MIERFPEPARGVFMLADEESDRLRHNYVGCEHVLTGLARHSSPAAGLLIAHGLDVDTLRGELDRLVAEGILPPPWRNHAALLDSLGVDLAAVRHSVEQAFGTEALDRATRQASRRTGWTPLCGKAHMFKRGLQIAHEHRVALGHPSIGPETILLGVLEDAQDPLDKPRCFNNPWTRRRRNALGLPYQGPSPVRLLLNTRGTILTDLCQAARAQLYATNPTR
jgi:hypothetical protein